MDFHQTLNTEDLQVTNFWVLSSNYWHASTFLYFRTLTFLLLQKPNLSMNFHQKFSIALHWEDLQFLNFGFYLLSTVVMTILQISLALQLFIFSKVSIGSSLDKLQQIQVWLLSSNSRCHDNISKLLLFHGISLVPPCCGVVASAMLFSFQPSFSSNCCNSPEPVIWCIL